MSPNVECLNMPADTDWTKCELNNFGDSQG